MIFLSFSLKLTATYSQHAHSVNITHIQKNMTIFFQFRNFLGVQQR
jgi:hypothetical protein